MQDLAWWQRAVVYQVYPRSFQDTNGDGVGDLPGVVRRLDYLADLGVDAIWLSPFYPSPQEDFGYDVSDYCDVDPLFGTLADFDRLLTEAHARGLRVIIDLVPNHTSDRHPWFLESRSSRTNPKRDWYVWRDPSPDGGPPNNWRSVFGGSAWTFDPSTGQYYLHHFLPQQPDLNYRNPEVLEAMLEVMRFWLRRGVDGFRVDVLPMLVEDAYFRDEPENPRWRQGMPEYDRLLHIYTVDQPETHAVARRMRQVLEEFSAPGRERVMIGETYLPFDRLVRYYGTPEAPEAHLPFNFHLIEDDEGHPVPWDPDAVRRIVEAYEAALPPWGWPNWVLGNHDRPRIASRVGAPQTRVAAMLLLTLRGVPTWYYGDEIGMENGPIPPEECRDPAGRRQPEIPWACRDPERTPMQWDDSPYAGFSTVEPWLPVNPDYPHRNVRRQQGDPRSLLNLVRTLLRLRRDSAALTGGGYATAPAPNGVYAYTRSSPDERLLVALNFTAMPQLLEASGDVLVSTHLDRTGAERSPIALRPDEGVLLRLP